MHRHWVPGLSQGGRGLGTRLKSSSQTHPGTYTCGAVAQSLQGCIIKVLGLTQNCGYTCLEPCCNTSGASYTFHSNCPEQNSLLQIYVSLNRLMTLWEATRDQVRDHCVPTGTVLQYGHRIQLIEQLYQLNPLINDRRHHLTSTVQQRAHMSPIFTSKHCTYINVSVLDSTWFLF